MPLSHAFPVQSRAARETGPQMQVRAGLKLLNYNKRVIIMRAYEHNLRAIWHELAMLNVKIEMISVHCASAQLRVCDPRWSLFLVEARES